jgi:TolB protein
VRSGSGIAHVVTGYAPPTHPVTRRDGGSEAPFPQVNTQDWGTVMHQRIGALVGTLILVAVGSISASSVAAAGDFQLESTIAFSSIRDNPTGNPFLAAEVYLISPDGTNPRRLTDNVHGDSFPTLSPDGKRIVFDSNRFTAGTVCSGVLNIDDLFLMKADGTDQMFLTRGASATWSPNGKLIAFHASALYHASDGLQTECPSVPFAGAAARDSDIFVVNVDDLLSGIERPTNITNSPTKIDDDADWSPLGQKLVFTNRDTNDPNQTNPVSAEIYVMNVDDKGMPTGVPQRLTNNGYEERGPAWSPDGTRIVFACRVGDPLPNMSVPTFEICVMKADGSNLVQLTDNNVFQDLTPTWSPDGQRIVFHRNDPTNQLWTMNPTLNPDGTLPTVTQVTSPPGTNLLANWGELRVKVDA